MLKLMVNLSFQLNRLLSSLTKANISVAMPANK